MKIVGFSPGHYLCQTCFPHSPLGKQCKLDKVAQFVFFFLKKEGVISNRRGSLWQHNLAPSVTVLRALIRSKGLYNAESWIYIFLFTQCLTKDKQIRYYITYISITQIREDFIEVSTNCTLRRKLDGINVHGDTKECPVLSAVV